MHKGLTFMQKSDVRGWLPLPSQGLTGGILIKQNHRGPNQARKPYQFKIAFPQIHQEDTKSLYVRPNHLPNLTIKGTARKWGQYQLRVIIESRRALYGLLDDSIQISLQLRSLTQHKATEPRQILQGLQKGLGTGTLPRSSAPWGLQKACIRNWSKPPSGVDRLSRLGGCYSLWAMRYSRPVSKNNKSEWVDILKYQEK